MGLVICGRASHEGIVVDQLLRFPHLDLSVGRYGPQQLAVGTLVLFGVLATLLVRPIAHCSVSILIGEGILLASGGVVLSGGVVRSRVRQSDGRLRVAREICRVRPHRVRRQMPRC